MYSPPNIPVTIKLRRVRWQRHVAGMAALRNTYKILVVNYEAKNTWKMDK
jgi:hypothetical protein